MRKARLLPPAAAGEAENGEEEDEGAEVGLFPHVLPEGTSAYELLVLPGAMEDEEADA